MYRLATITNMAMTIVSFGDTRADISAAATTVFQCVCLPGKIYGNQLARV